MAFINNNFGRVSSTAADVPVVYSYQSTGDTMANVLASAYFNEKINSLKVSDIIYVKSSDDQQFLKVTSITTNVTTAQFSEVVDDGSITTVKIADLAVTNAKIGPDAVSTTKILDVNVTTPKIALDAIDNTLIADNAVSLENLDAGITPSHITVFSDEHTTIGGAAAEVITVTGALATDLVYTQLHTVGAAPRTILTAISGTDTVTVTFSADPSTDHVLAYQVMRAAV